MLYGLMGVDLFYSLVHARDLPVWLLENILFVVGVGLVVTTHRWLVLSDVSYGCLAVFSLIHEYGAEHSYGKTPLGDWMRSWFHLARNDYDRVAHLCFGLLISYVVREVLIRSAGVRGRWAYRLPVFIVAGFAAIFEMFEAWVLVLSSGDANVNPYLALQGDIWDSQKDMFASTVGAGITMLGLFLWNQFRRKK